MQGDGKTSPSPLPAEPDQEELDFLFDEEMEQMAPRKNKFTDWSDEDDSDYELDDQDVNKILIVTQTPPYLKKHPSGDRTGNHESRAKITADLAKAINDGLYYYEQDLWEGEEQMEGSKVGWFFNLCLSLMHSFIYKLMHQNGDRTVQGPWCFSTEALTVG